MPPSALTGVVMVLLMSAHSAVWLALLYLVALVRFVVPLPAVRRACRRTFERIGWAWVRSNRFLLDRVARSRRVVRGVRDLDPGRSYLVCCNHVSWVDPLILATELQGHVPFLRFFAKRALLWLPFFGLAFWVLDFPFMRRYSPEHLERHPEDRGKDLETARALAEKFRRSPTSVVNFVEGTRFTREKHEAQASPYRNLLRPKAGGIAYVISAMGDQLGGLIDCTVAYPPGRAGFWEFLCGRIPWVAFEVRVREIPPAFLGRDYLEDPGHRDEVKAWLGAIWEEKDRRIDELRREASSCARLPASRAGRAAPGDQEGAGSWNSGVPYKRQD